MNIRLDDLDTLPDGLRSDALAPLLTPFLPALADFRAGLRAVLETHARAPGAIVVDGVALEAIWSERLARRWLHMSLPTLVLELNCERELEHLAGDTPEERFEHFVSRLRERDRVAALRAEYAVLARQMDDRARQTVEFAREFLARLAQDGAELRRSFFAGGDPGALVEAETGAGDAHADGRSVMLLRFAAGGRLVYKPRSLAVDVRFGELLQWCADRGAPHRLRVPRALERGTHGWAEYVAAASCDDAAGVERFHERLGGLLAMLHVVRAVDMHLENLVAAGDQPVVVDLETLFHPSPASLAARSAARRATAAALDDSMLRVGMLPYRLDTDPGGVDLSGIAGAAGQHAPDPVLRWRDVGRDTMHAYREKLPIAAGQNRARLAGVEVDATDHAEALSAGFHDQLRWLIGHSAELVARDGPLRRFARDHVRVVMRPTRVYGLLLDESWNPDVLREDADRDALLGRLSEVSETAELEAVVDAERHDLRAGDVPAFSSAPGSRELWTSRGERLREFFPESALDEACRRLAAMDVRDLERESWLVRAVLGMETLNRDRGRWTTYVLLRPARAGDPAARRTRLLEHASAVGRWFERMAVGDDERATWIALDFRGNGWTVNADALDLYSGLPGIVLFLARLGECTGDPAPTRLARRGLRATLEAFDRLAPERRERGLFQGVAGLVYVCDHLAALWRDRELAAAAGSLLETVAPLCESDAELDVVAGNAGVVAAALAHERVAGDGRGLALANACGKRLAAAVRRDAGGPVWSNALSGDEPATGFAHGTAGIAHALLLLARAGGAHEYATLARAALAAESEWLGPALARWASGDAAVEPTALAAGAERTLSMSWCYGVPGLLVARLGALATGPDEALRREAGTLARAVAEAGFGRNHSLCHGDLGNLDALLLASEALDDDPLREAVSGWTDAVLDSVDDGGWRCGTMSAVEAPGLMNGLAGVGYGLLRLADPRDVPSLLALEPPE